MKPTVQNLMKDEIVAKMKITEGSILVAVWKGGGKP